MSGGVLLAGPDLRAGAESLLDHARRLGPLPPAGPDLIETIARSGLLPELIRLDDCGYPILSPGAVPEHLAAHARRTMANCPVLALALRGAGPGDGGGRR